MTESPAPYVDPAHRVPDDQWGAVVRRANEIAAAENEPDQEEEG